MLSASFLVSHCCCILPLGSLNLAVNRMAEKQKNGAATAVGCLGALVGIRVRNRWLCVVRQNYH